MQRRPLADVLPAAAHVLGVPGLASRGTWLEQALPGSTRHIMVLLADGLGAVQLADHPADAPVLTGLPDLGPVATPFPSTTSVSLASFGTGLPPGMHGIVGSLFRLDDGSVLAPLSWGQQPNPIATQPEPTLLERASDHGLLVVSASPAAHRRSGLTRAALRGGEYVGAETLADRVDAAAATLRRARGEGRASLTYVYWPELDKAGHVHGAGSPQWRAELAVLDELVAGLAALTGPDIALLVTADHGMVTVPDERRVDLEAIPELRRGVRAIMGEPRARHVYARAGSAGDVLARWTEVLGPRALVLSRAQASELLGPVDEWYADRVGDVVAVARDNWALASDRVDRKVSALRGQHGGLTDAEVLVPLRVCTGGSG